MKRIILIGNGGHSKVIKDIIDESSDYTVVGFLDNKFYSYEKNGNCFMIIYVIYSYIKKIIISA